ncbi:MAG: GNAT family N-acetyltransferase [Rhodospirillaceae bacterium]
MDIRIRPYAGSDLPRVREIFIDWNRAIAPEGLKDQFEAYIQLALKHEIERIPDYYAPDGWGFWAAEVDGVVAGCCGLEGLPEQPGVVEVRRMYVASEFRRRGIGRAMMADLEAKARGFGYERIVLSTSALQPQAKALYIATGYDLIREEASTEQTIRTVGSGLVRFYFEKPLR